MKVSVIISTYNGEKYLNECMILNEYNNNNLIRPETIFQLAHEILINKETYT